MNLDWILHPNTILDFAVLAVIVLGTLYGVSMILVDFATRPQKPLGGLRPVYPTTESKMRQHGAGVDDEKEFQAIDPKAPKKKKIVRRGPNAKLKALAATRKRKPGGKFAKEARR